jgi:hypothetical protein
MSRKTLTILGVFVKLRKATIILPASVEQLCSYWTDFHEIWYLSIFRKSGEKIQFSLKSGKNNGYVTWRPMYMYDNVAQLFLEREMF